MDAVAAEVERASLVDLRLAGGFYLIIRDEGEGIHCCRIQVAIHSKLYGDIICRALQRAPSLRQGRRSMRRRRQMYEIRNKDREHKRERKRKYASYYPCPPPPPQRRHGRTYDTNPICHPHHSRYIHHMW